GGPRLNAATPRVSVPTAGGAEETPGYPVMSALIRLGCKVAIATAKRI
ncbi:MAG: hypothetical protein EOP67_36450, partial [Sphingomonas sp.]